MIPWSDLEPHWRDRLGRAIDRSIAQKAQAGPADVAAVWPESIAELSDLVRATAQTQHQLLPFGSGSKLAWGWPIGQGRPGSTDGLAGQDPGAEGGDRSAVLAIGLGKLNQVIHHDESDLVVTVEAGTRWADVQAHLAATGQWLPIDPCFPETTTIGGAIATADTGSLRQRYGGWRDLLLGLSLVRWDGEVAKAGGRVVKNVAGYDLMKLMTGAFGTLGIVSQATFRTYPRPEVLATLELSGAAEPIDQVRQALLASSLTPIALDLLSDRPGQVRLAVRFGSVAAATIEQSQRVRDLGASLNLTVTDYAGPDEDLFWSASRARVTTPEPTAITVKWGTLPSAAIATLAEAQKLFPAGAVSQIQAGSGLGRAKLTIDPDQPLAAIPAIQTLRQFCQNQGGFLTLLDRPDGLQTAIDPWGYSGNALGLMRKIADQFDPHRRLNPGRFLV